MKISFFLKQGILLLSFLMLFSGFFSFIIYRQDTQSFFAVMQNNESQILDFQEELVKEHFKTLDEDIEHLSNLQSVRMFIKSGFQTDYDLVSFTELFLKRKGIYTSMRIIDANGLERFRMDYDGKNVHKIPENSLQFKGNRYYYKEIMTISPEDVYYSDLDFNYEQGKMVYPYEPTLRTARVFLDEFGGNEAFIILNYNGRNLLDHLDEHSVYSYGNIFLINKEDWIISIEESKSEEKIQIIDFLNTDEGKIFIKQQETQIHSSFGFLSHKRIKISDSPMSPKWDFISLVNSSNIKAQTVNGAVRGIILFASMFLVSIFITLISVRNKANSTKLNFQNIERAKIFDFNPAPVIKASAVGEILSSNVAAKKILGLGIYPGSIYSVFKNRGDLKYSLKEADEIFHFEYPFGEKNYYITSIREPSSGQIYFYGADITENSLIREELINFQIAVKQSANTIVFTDLDGRVLFANDAFEKVTGYSSEEVMGKRTDVLNSGYHSDAFYKKLWETISIGKVWTGEFYNKKKNGSYFWEKATITPVLDNSGNPRFYIAVKEDITEKKAIEAELKMQTQLAESAREAAEEARSEAETANQLKSSFLANMSHEIRTPMNAILGFTSLLLNKDLEKKDLEMLEIIMKSGKNLLELINDILDFSKIEADEIELTLVKINMQIFFESIKDLFFIQTQQKGLDFKIEMEKDLPVIINGDENRIRQILINIIGNAIKFTDKGSIIVLVSWVSDGLNIKVSDTGIGIAPDKQEDIFSPFKQSDSSTMRKYEGTGLGLSISLKLITLMGGTIKLESRLGKGSDFTINLPLKICDEPEMLYDHLNKEPESSDPGQMIQTWLQNADDEIVASIISDAIVALPRYLNRLKMEIEKEDFIAVQAISHELLGSTGNLGMMEIYEPLKDLNEGIKNDSLDISGIQEIYSHLEMIISNIPVEFMEEKPSELLPIDNDTAIHIDVLTADDNSVNRQLIDAMLKSIFIQSDFAVDGYDVLEKLDRKKYDILLLDIQMPRLDGLETIKRIRENEKYKNLYVIAVTANAMSGDAQVYIDGGCNDYISKPVQRDLFLKKIEFQIQKINKIKASHYVNEDYSEIPGIISLLEKEYNIFNPGRVREIASSLEFYSSDKQISSIIERLNDSADSFDSHGLKSIIEELKELTLNG